MDIETRLAKIESRIARLSTEIHTPRADYSALYGSADTESIPNAAYTIIDYELKYFDRSNCVTTGATWKYTAKRDGMYLIIAAVSFASSTTWESGEALTVRVYVNEAQQRVIGRFDGGTANGILVYAYATGITAIEMFKGDYCDVRAYQSSDGALNLREDALYNFVYITPIDLYRS